MPRDYYDILGVAKDADAKAIKNAFRDLAKKYHPDRNPEPEAEEKFKELAEAYAMLSDPDKRARYDAGGHARVAGYSAEDLYGGIDFADLFRGQGGSFDLGAIFGGFGRPRRTGPPHGADVETLLRVPMEIIARGGKETVRLAHPRACKACSGSGAKAGTSPRVCDGCQGSGRSVKRHSEGATLFQQITVCPTCGGAGRFIDDPCTECSGTGRVTEHESLEVTIPPGIRETTALRIPGRGHPGPQPGGEPGDLLVYVSALPDPRFTRRGADLVQTRTIDVVDAVLGTRIEIPTLDGRASVSIPAGTQHGAVLRLRGKGLPVWGRDDLRGNLYLQLEIRIPTELTKAERKLYQKLRAARPAKTDES